MMLLTSKAFHAKHTLSSCREARRDISNCLLHYLYRLLQKKIDEQGNEISMEKFSSFCAHLLNKVLSVISDLSHGEEEKYDDEDKDEVSW